MALGTATLKSVRSTKMNPPPMAYPLMAAITGLSDCQSL